MSSPAGLRALLGGRRFRQLLLTRLAGQVGDGIFQIALASFVIFNPNEHASAAKIAAGFATLLLPYSLVGPMAGVLIDRWRRQRILMYANILRGLLVVTVALTVASGVQGLLFYAVALAVVGVNRFVLSALAASLPHVVDEKHLVSANALSTTLGTVTVVVGAIAGLGMRRLVGSDDSGTALVALGASLPYLLASLAAAKMPAALLGPAGGRMHAPLRDAVGDVAAGIRDGARHIWGRRPARLALAAIGAHRLLYGISTVSTLLLYRNYFTDRGWIRADLEGLGQILGASSVGVLLAASVTPAATRRFGKPRWIAACLALAALVEATFAATFRQEGYLAAAFALAFAAQCTKICVDTIVQESIDDAFRGRVFAFYDIVFNVAFVSACVLAAVLLPATGRSFAVLALLSAGYAAAAVAYTRAAATSRPVQKAQRSVRGARPPTPAAGEPLPHVPAARAPGEVPAETPEPPR